MEMKSRQKAVSSWQKFGGLARSAPPGYPLQVRPSMSQRTSGFSLLSLAELFPIND
jgi:hypothetical protein